MRTAAVLARADDVERLLYVVEFEGPDGKWRPLAGDAYLDRDEAVRVSVRSKLKTRIVPYVPKGER